MAHTAAGDAVAACWAALQAVSLSPGGHLGVLPAEAAQQPQRVPPGLYPQIGLRAAGALLCVCEVYLYLVEQSPSGRMRLL